MTIKNLFIVGVLAVLIAIGVNTGFSIVAYDSVHAGTVHNCEEIEVVKSGLRATIEEANHLTQNNKARKAPERKQSQKYFEDVLAQFRARNCNTELDAKGNHATRIPPKAVRKHRDKASHLHH